MGNSITLILFLSEYRGQPESEYSTDRDFTVRGAQTNEAPVSYTIQRLAKKGEKLSRIIALVTPKAKASALERFKEVVSAKSPETTIAEVEIPDNVTVTELLRRTLEALLPTKPSDSVVIESTGGYRRAVNAITLLTRFLRYSKVGVLFSTYSDLAVKHVGDTRETDELSALLDAVNVFAVTGNAREIKKLFGQWKLDEKTAFFRAADKFYNSLLVCRAPSIESNILELRDAIESLKNAEYGTEEPKLLIFRELVLTIVEQKMTFLYSESILLDFIKWCSDNWYLQQAVTFLRESLVGANPKSSSGSYILTKEDYHVLRVLRNSINHASGKAEYDKSDPCVTEKIVEKVNKLLENTNEIKGFVESLLKKYELSSDSTARVAR